MKIKINNKDRVVKFGFGATRRIVEHYGYTKPSDYEKLVKKFNLNDLETKEPTFEQLGFLGELFKAGILNGGSDDDFSADDVIDACLNDATVMTALITEFQKSQVQNEVVDPSSRNGGK